MSRPTTVEDILSKCVRAENGCLEWTRYRHHGWYGQIGYKNKTMSAHRVHWILVNGDIPKGMVVMHICDNPKCVELSHLRLGTQGENTYDCINKKRAHWQNKTHCKRGHEYTGGNVRLLTGVTGPWRVCLLCERDNVRRAGRKRRARLKAEKDTIRAVE